MKNVFIGIILFLFCVESSVFAANPKIRINEILIDPNQSIELYNSDTMDVDISGWFIDDSGGTTYFTVPPNTILPAQKCAVFSSAFSLNKSTPDVARLFDATAAPTDASPNLIDSYAYSTGPSATLSFQRIPDGEPIWAIAPASLGVRNLDNTSCIVIPSPTPTPTGVITPTPTEIPPLSVNNVFISEAGVNPLSSTSEWVELFNNSEFEVTLDGWFIDDIRSGGATKVEFSRTIAAKSYSVIELDASLFNNSGDEINLLNNNEQLMDAVAYDASVKGLSVGRTELLGVSACIMQPTLTLPNSSCVISTTLTPTPKVITITPTLAPDKTVKGAATKHKPTPPTQSKTNQGKKFNPTSPTTKNLSPIVKVDEKNKANTFEITTDEPRKIARTLSFSSLSASILTIISLVFRMRGE